MNGTNDHAHEVQPDSEFPEDRTMDALVKLAEVPAADIERGGEALGISDDANVAATSTRPHDHKQIGVPQQFAKVEKSLASLGFFTPSSRRIKHLRMKRVHFTREAEGRRVEVTADILATIFGLPITADQDKYLALQDIITDVINKNGTVSNPIRFTTAELLRKMNRSVRSGKNYKEVAEWLDVMVSTTIKSDGAVYNAGQKRFATDRFHVFDRAVSVGKELEDGTIADANYVWLSKWQLENIAANHVMPIDIPTYNEVKNRIARTLIPLLQTWLFASQKAGSFKKSYDDLCEVLGLQRYTRPSHITRQFKASLDELVRYGYLEKWKIEKMSDKKSYMIVLFHGAKFHRDRRKRIEQKAALEGGIVIAESDSQAKEPNLPEPGRMGKSAEPATIGRSEVGADTQRRQPEVSIIAADPGQGVTSEQGGDTPIAEEPPVRTVLDDLVERGVMASAAAKLLDSLPTEQQARVPDYIEYWDSVKQRSDVGPGLLFDLIRKQESLPPSFESRRQRFDRMEREDRERRLAQERESAMAAYEDYIAQTIEDLIDRMPKGEYDKLYAAEEGKLLENNFFREKRGTDTFKRTVERTIRIKVRTAAEVMSFDEFVAAQSMSESTLVEGGAERNPSGSQSVQSIAPAGSESDTESQGIGRHAETPEIGLRQGTEPYHEGGYNPEPPSSPGGF